ncbi:hypothetical protein E7T09_16220 [Deinococcus sp. KSM4-11]|uniref:hypothetical protein n=1 Tax=Deinococcus sp. KSM4-11 TaxID=2568654 RepID=UPI0010A3076A|nr:hypothetical protein [Deinococcus sp. KSM4-11]THF85501.1 hypothetical protein E7T09_16220 [Deinococcus sp. KSM4-11]
MDSREIRTFLDRQLPYGRGGRLYDEWCPYAQLPPLPHIEDPPVWIAWGRGQTVATAWWELLAPGHARVVALTGPMDVDLLEPLLAQIEVSISLSIDRWRLEPLRVAAWLPDSPLRMDMEAIYGGRGWTAEPLWHVRLTGHLINRAPIEDAVAAAQRHGIEIRPPTLEEQAVLDLRPRETSYLQFSTRRRMVACVNGRPVALNGVGESPVRGRVAWVRPEWLTTDCDDPQLVMNALLGACLLMETEAPAELVAPWPVTAYGPWFSSPFEPLPVHQYVRKVARAHPALSPSPPEYIVE